MPHHALHEGLCLRILDEKLVCIEKYRREYELKNKSCSSTVVIQLHNSTDPHCQHIGPWRRMVRC